ncbi:hypothetical protein [Actinomadura keratinilytica]|jgi:hypothetical protein|uniref:Uncharacterized protein n=1 Tax=Actinomadura keratinilytica TaxID=547461 RepID=A0ABP7Z4L0_9ACTN
MNLSDRQRRFLFAGLVVVLAVIGVYLTVAAPDGDGEKETGGRSAAAVPSATGPASPPPGISSAVDPNSFDIYRLLPFSQREFATAADVAQRFVAAHGTYRYDEGPQTYAQRLSGLVTDDLLTELVRGESSPGQLEERRRRQEVAECTATLDRVRDIEDNSIIFLVTGKQQVTRGGQKSENSRQWAVTVARDGGAMRVYAVAPADEGQAGDTG